MEPKVDVDAYLRGVLQQLQAEPGRYKLFGIWWWPIKALLKRQYGPAQLYMLGGYQDAAIVALVPHMGLEDTLRAAAEEYQQNATFPRPGGFVEDPDGDLVRIFDEDAGI